MKEKFENCRMGCCEVVSKPEGWDNWDEDERSLWLSVKELSRPLECSLCIERGGWEKCWFSMEAARRDAP